MFLTLQWRLNQYISDGEEIGYVLVAADLTSQKQMAFELSIKNRAIDEASTAIVISDMRQAEQPVVYANKSFLDLTGYDLDEVIGENCRITRAIIDKACHIEDGTIIGEDLENDRKRFHVTESGIVLVTPEMLGQHLYVVDKEMLTSDNQGEEKLTVA